MQSGWTKILCDGQDVASGIQQITHGRFNFFRRLPHTENQIRLGHQTNLFGGVGDAEQPIVSKCRPDRLHQTRNCFQVMREYRVNTPKGINPKFWSKMTKQNLLARNCINTSRQLVELAGIEPATSSMPWKRATNCAIAPKAMSHLHKPVR